MTVSTPSARQALITRSAISPRLATKTRERLMLSLGLACGLDDEKRLVVFHELTVLHEDFDDLAAHSRLHGVEDFHDFDQADGRLLVDFRADLDERLRAGLGRRVESPDHRSRDLVARGRRA